MPHGWEVSAMVVEFKRDLHHNYMIINDVDNNDMEPFCLKILKFQKIDGILPIEQRNIDNQVSFYYDITAKQSMKNLYDKTTLSCIKVKRLVTRMIDTIEKAYEYLLMEDDFILAPEHIYLDVTSGMPYLCYLSGYHKNIKEQMKCFIEYIMNKIDYNDKEAVLLVYSLYAACKEEAYTLEHLLELLKKQFSETDQEYKDTSHNRAQTHKQAFVSESEKASLKITQSEGGLKSQPETIGSRIPVMKERLINEEEELHYSYKTYLYTGGCIIGGIAFLGFGFVSKIAYNTYGNQINYSKLFAMILLIFCMEGYLIKKLWHKKNRHSKLVSTKEYVNPFKELYNKNLPKVIMLKDKLSTKDGSKSENFHSYVNREDVYYEKGKPKIDKVEQRFHDKILIRDYNEDDEVFKNIECDQPTRLLNNIMPNQYNNFEQEANDKQAAYINEDMSINPQETNINQNRSIKEETYLQEASKPKNLMLKPMNDTKYESILIMEFPFFIGKLKQNVDYCLEKDVISRYHAKISKEQDQYYITDLNSKNGTFVNNEVVDTYQSKEINVGDEITFADIKYCLLEIT